MAVKREGSTVGSAGEGPNSRRRPSRWRRSAAGVIFTALVSVLFVTGPVRGMGSLPTGPSERGNESEISSSTKLSDMLPAQIRLLTDREFQAVFEREVAAARSEVVLCHHLFAVDEERKRDRGLAVAEVLAQAVSRGVDVIVVLEIGREVSPVTIANRRTARFLQRRGIRVYMDMSGTVVHTRMAVVDRRLVFLGSHDMTQQSLGRYREASLVLESSPLATSVLSYIESLDPVTYRE